MDEDIRLGRLQPGLQVCDVLGEKIGTLAHVHQQEHADQPSSEASAATPSMADKVVEVKTGPLGLGKHLYIPTPAIETVTDDQVVLNRRRDELESEDFSTRPDNLRQVI